MNTATPPLPSRARPTPNLKHAFGGVWRLTVARLLTRGHLFAFGILMALLATVAIAMLYSRGGLAGYVGWTIDTYFTFLVPVLAFVNAGGAMRDDLRSSTLDYVLIRPVPRPAYVGFKYIAHVVGAQVEFLLAALLLVVLGSVYDTGLTSAVIAPLLLAQFMLVLAFSALGFVAGVLTNRYVILGLAYGAIVEVGVGQIPTELSRLSMTHQVKALLATLDPRRIANTALDTAGGPDALATYSMLVAVTAGALGIAAVVFLLREHGGATEA